jgi:uncharacterized NAD(P)/FAD-binding protein YdhS
MKKIAIIGSGFSGTMCAVHLLQQTQIPLHIFLIDKKDFGRGVAYASIDDCLLLNVRASNMSAFPDKPAHFIDWLKAKGLKVDSHDFISRNIYGDYLNALLEEAQKSTSSRLEIINDEVKNIESGNVVLSQASLQVDKIILAIGLEFKPVDFKKILQTPNEPLTVIGTGLSMVDLVVYLNKHNYKGKIKALSRHGRLPSAHVLFDSNIPKPAYNFADNTKLSSVFTLIKSDIKKYDWRLVIDAIRPHTQKLWKEFSFSEKKQFLRHCRSLWDVHRHRMSPDHNEILNTKRTDGSLEIIKAGFKKYKPETQTVIELKGLAFDSTPGLIHTLLQNNIVKKDSLSLGLATDNYGQAAPAIYTLGPLRRGELWECTAVPEIRAQADALVKHILKDMALSNS